MWLLLPQFHPVAVTVEILVPGKGEWNGHSSALTVSSPNLPLWFTTWKASSLSCYAVRHPQALHCSPQEALPVWRWGLCLAVSVEQPQGLGKQCPSAF